MSSIKKLRKDTRNIFQAALKAADPYETIKDEVSLQGNRLKIGHCRYDIGKFHKLFVIGAGKGSGRMAQAIEEILGPHITDGFVVVKYGYTAPLKKIKIHEAAHPIPDRQGLHGTEKIMKLLQHAGEKDLIIFLISGGGSALLPSPQKGIPFQDKQRLTNTLLKCGATIREINVLRKHLSKLKGGRLAKLAYPATLVSLILSDIIGDPVDSIASGPTAPDSSTFRNCLEILNRYKVANKTSPAILNFLLKGSKGHIEETPKERDRCFLKTQNLIVGNNFKSVKAAFTKAKQLGYHSLILSTMIEGETREVAKVHAAILKEIFQSGNPIKIPACIISGGETTVTIRGKGLGGRNQEFVLASAIEIKGMKHAVVASIGTDGTDGPTDAAGAIADGLTVSRAEMLNMHPIKYLNENNAYHFFKGLDDLIITGPTNTNVMDIRIMLGDKAK